MVFLREKCNIPKFVSYLSHNTMRWSSLSPRSTTDIKFDFAMCCSAHPAAQARLMMVCCTVLWGFSKDY